MSKQLILILILALALICCILEIIYIKYININSIKQKAVLENIQSRKSVRHFVKDKEISDENIEKILKAAMAAPSARNMQPWEFIVIKDKNILNSFGQNFPFGKMLADASLAIVVAGDTKFNNNETNEYWVQDTSAATQNLLLAIEALGLGAVWIGVYPKEDRIEPIARELALPDNILPLNIVAVGYPTGEDKPKDKWKTQKIHYEKF